MAPVRCSPLIAVPRTTRDAQPELTRTFPAAHRYTATASWTATATTIRKTQTVRPAVPSGWRTAARPRPRPASRPPAAATTAAVPRRRLPSCTRPSPRRRCRCPRRPRPTGERTVLLPYHPPYTPTHASLSVSLLARALFLTIAFMVFFWGGGRTHGSVPDGNSTNQVKTRSPNTLKA